MEFLPGLTGEIVVRRYMSLAKFLHLVQNKQLFFSKMAAFPDKLEGRVTPIDDFMLCGNDRRLADVLEAGPSVKAEEPPAKNLEGRDYARSINTPFGELSGEGIQQKLDLQKNWIDVSCWARGEGESLALWKLFGGQEPSVCLTTNLQALSDALCPPAGVELYAGVIDYITDDDCNFDDHELSYFMRKRDCYSFENEIRLVAFCRSDDWEGERTCGGRGVLVDLKALVNYVTVSPGSDAWFHQLLSDVVSERFGLKLEFRPSKIIL